MINALLFDLGNVLFFFDPDKSLKQASKICGTTKDKLKAFYAKDDKFAKLENGALSTVDFLALHQKEFKKTLDFEALVMALSDIFLPNEELELTIIKAKKAGYKLIAISNTNELHSSFLEANFTILKVFDARIYSFQVGTLKPDLKIFEEAVKASGVPKEECLLIDDLKENIEGAEKFGMSAIQYLDPMKLLKDLEAARVNLNRPPPVTVKFD